jgi:hypothetical protein
MFKNISPEETETTIFRTRGKHATFVTTTPRANFNMPIFQTDVFSHFDIEN